MPLHSLGIRGRLIIMVLTALLLSILVASFFIRNLVYDNITNQKITTADILTASLVHDVKYEYNYSDKVPIDSIISKYLTYYRIIQNIHYYAIDAKSLVSFNPNNDNVTLFADIQASEDAAILNAVNKAKPSIIVSILDNSELSIRSVSPVLQGSKVIGAIVTYISTDDINDLLSTIRLRMMIILLIISTGAVIILYAFLHTSLLTRLSRVIDATREISTGNYDIRVNDPRQDELGQLSQSFDQMTEDLQQSRIEIDNHNQIMDQKVKDATAELQQAYEDLKNAQGQIVLNEKMASLGVLISGIAHEINTPIGSISNISRNLVSKVSQFPELLLQYDQRAIPSQKLAGELMQGIIDKAFNISGTPSFKEIRKVEQALRDIGVEGWREKSGTLATLNYTNVGDIEKFACCLKSDWLFRLIQTTGYIARAAKISETSSHKIHDIIRALKFYAYTDRDKIEATQLNDSVQTSLVLISSRIKHNTVDVDTDFDPDLPEILCTCEIHQIWTVLLNNAIDVIEDRIEESGEDYRGQISIQTYRECESVCVRITDNGGGIPKEIIGKIYDPFFTTKDIGKGTGLGLSIVSGIVNKQGGTIHVSTEDDQTTFVVSIPIEANSKHQGKGPSAATFSKTKP